MCRIRKGMALGGWDPVEGEPADGAQSNAPSGTFATRARRVQDDEARATNGDHERLIRAFLLGTAHEQSSPLGALLANLNLARDDLDRLLSEGRVGNEAVGNSLHTLREDLDDALRMVGRLRRLGEHIKRLALKDEASDFDLREIIPLATVVASSYGTPRIQIQYSFEPGDTESQNWIVSTHGVRFVVALTQVARDLVGSSDQVAQCLRLSARTIDHGARLLLELEHRNADPVSGVAARNKGTTDTDFLRRLDDLVQDSNFRVVRESTQLGVSVDLESIHPSSV